MQHLPAFKHENLLIGPEQFSDAGVYRIDDRTALVQSVDFFPPLVDDPCVFGQIAAANALSDLYAMGARPLTALNIVGFPDDQLPLDVLQEILRGGAERVAAADAVILGGHSVRDAEIKYGLCVTGLVDPARMLTNRGARPGDALVLTKALGTGFVTTANRAERCPADTLAAACAAMIQLNRAAGEAALELEASAATDVTGYGLAGHGMEMAQASDVTLAIDLAALPLLPGSEALANETNRTRANRATSEYLGDGVRFEGEPDATRREYLFDPQTSGGLLVALAPERADDFTARCREAGQTAAARIGVVREREDADVVINKG